MSNPCVFAIDFTHEEMTAAFVFPDGREEGRAGLDLADLLAHESGALERMVSLFAAKARTAPAPIDAVSVALPCDLDPGRTRVVSFPAAPWLTGQPLADILQNALGAPVLLERRAVILLSYDLRMLGLPLDSLVVGCYVDTHYDTAIWHCGAPILGKNGLAGNIAHMTIHDREDPCFCGKTGCVHLYGAGVRLRQIHTMIFPDTPLELIFERNADHPIIRDYLAMMAYPIAIQANVLDPDFLVIGGSVPAMRGFPRQLLEEAIVEHVYRPEAFREATFLPSSASASSGLVCAAQYAFMKRGIV